MISKPLFQWGVDLASKGQPQDGWHRGHSSLIVFTWTRICFSLALLTDCVVWSWMCIEIPPTSYVLCGFLLGCAVPTESYWYSAIDLTKICWKFCNWFIERAVWDWVYLKVIPGKMFCSRPLCWVEKLKYACNLEEKLWQT